jgi:endoglucanase
MYRLKALSWLLFLLPLLLSCAFAAEQDPDWSLFKERFVRSDGSVVDTGNEGVSHTEGQGVTMLLAVHYKDRATFDSTWLWTRKMLQVREDKLLSWRWVAGEGVADKNNASDGDIFAAWSLLRAHRLWKDPAYLVYAQEIMADIRKTLVRKTGYGTILLPGAVGFEKDDGTIVNLSYWIFPAFDEFAQIESSGDWLALKESGLRLLEQARFGRWDLPPDWMLVGEKITLHAQGRFGYDAVRIPLYLLWGKADNDRLRQPFQSFWSYFKGASFLPAWTSLSDNSIDSFNASVGIRSIAQFTLGNNELQPGQLPALDKTQEYYSAILLLLTKMALIERSR